MNKTQIAHLLNAAIHLIDGNQAHDLSELTGLDFDSCVDIRDSFIDLWDEINDGSGYLDPINRIKDVLDNMTD